MTQRQGIACAATRLIGTPFRHQGRRPGLGVDCLGVWVCSLRDAQVPVTDYTRYPRFPSAEEFRSRLSAQFEEVAVPGVGDLIVMTVGKHGRARHCGVVVSSDEMIDVEHRGRVKRSRIPWHRVESAWRVRGAS